MNKPWLALLMVLCVLVGSAVYAAPPGGHASAHTPRPLITDNTSYIDANNIKMIVTNHGSFAYDLTAQSAGLWFPKGTEKTAVYASGLWIGCRVNGEVRVTTGSYAQEYGPGPMIDATHWSDAGLASNRVYKIVKGDTTSRDYLEWPADEGAPVDAHGKPLLMGDQTLWCVYNDLDPSLHVDDAGNSAPLGVEVQQTTFAFDWKGALGNTVFVKFRVINKGTNTLDSTFFSVWSDPDLGGASDDYVGCDTTLSVGYCYNATNSDNLYDGKPPCVGYDFFQGPIGDTGHQLPMVSFNKYINGTDPRATLASYNYMRGLSREGAVVTDPTTGRATKFMDPGDPVANTGWLDSDPADRRFMLSAGPFTMAPGDTQNVVIGIVIGQGNDRIGSVRVMKFYDQTAQIAYDLGFNLPSAPDRPVVDVAALDGKIRLSWGTGSEIERAPGYAFEGYNVYQSASISAAGPWTLIATYDLNDNIGTIEDLTLDVNFGLPIVEPVQFGNDGGIKRYLEITDDKVRGVPLRNGTPYYYRVSAYSYNPTPEAGLPKTLEGFSNMITAIPQEPVSEATIMQALDDCSVVHGRVSTDIPLSTDKVTVFIADPFQLTGHTYRVDFREASPPETVGTGSNQYIAYYKWNLKDKSTGLYLYDAWQTNKSGDGNYEVTDGFVAKVVGSFTDGGLRDAVDVGPDGCHQVNQLTSVDAGMGLQINSTGYKGVGYAMDWGWGGGLDPSVNPEKFGTVEIRFSHTATQKCYRLDRPGYAITGFLEQPFQVWDVTHNKQLNACFVEWTASGIYDDIWDPDASDVGGREYFFVMASEYDPNGGVYTPDNFGPNTDFGAADGLYALWLKRSAAGVEIEDGSILRLVWGKQSTDNDYFEFVPAAETFSAAKAKPALSDIRVVPNPYFAKSSYEMDQFHHIIKFSNLPRRCTIRIFNVAGDLVRTLEKTDPNSSIMTWDLFNEQAIPVASGFYIYHVDAPGIGSTYGKMAIFLEKERLNTF